MGCLLHHSMGPESASYRRRGAGRSPLGRVCHRSLLQQISRDEPQSPVAEGERVQRLSNSGWNELNRRPPSLIAGPTTLLHSAQPGKEGSYHGPDPMVPLPA